MTRIGRIKTDFSFEKKSAQIRQIRVIRVLFRFSLHPSYLCGKILSLLRVSLLIQEQTYVVMVATQAAAIG